MIGTCGDPGVELNKEGNRFESFRPGSCPEPKLLFNRASDATFANSCSPKSIGRRGWGKYWLIMDLVKMNP